MALSPLYDAGGNPLLDAGGNQLYVFTVGPDPIRTTKVMAERRMARVTRETS